MSHELKTFFGIIAFLALGRFYELYLTKRNERVWLEELNAMEVGVQARKLMIIMHIGWFVAVAYEAIHFGSLASIPIQILSFSMLICAQLLRLHSMSMLKELWSTRVYRCENPPVCREGLFSTIKHPNYIAVILEFIAVPLQFNLWWSLVIFNILNLLFLKKRMKLEEEVLGHKLAPWRMIPGLY